MTLSLATIAGSPAALRGSAPYHPAALAPLRGVRFALPADDPWVQGTGDPDHAYLDGARGGWIDHPEYMDFLDPTSPVHDLKRAEADLVMHHWGAHLDAARVLDVGCGIGRFGLRWLDRGATVYGADPDLESLRRFAWHAADHDGAIDLFWCSVHHLPEVRVDLAVASEVLCYVPEAASALRAIASRVTPGGHVLLSLEARWGWAAAQDAPAQTIAAALGGDGIVAVAGERWVQTYDEDAVRSLIAAANLELVALTPSHWIPDGPLEDAGPASLSLQELVALEAQCQAHPVWGPLHRLWLVTARVPA